MTAALSARFPGASVERVRISDLAAGTNGRARLWLRYRSGAGPAAVFVKREGRLFNRLALSALGAVDAEARLFASAVALPLEHPDPYAATMDRRRLAAVVVMEDVTQRGARPNAATAPLGVDAVARGLEGLAHLHAAHWGRPLPDALAWLQPWRLGPAWAPVSAASLAWGRRRLRAGGHGGLLPCAGIAELEAGFRRWALTAASGPQTLLHGDPHPGNTYTLADGGVGFYDWQLVRTGHATHDVGYFVISSLEVAERRTHEADLLAGYLQALGKCLVGPPGFAHFWTRYRQSAAYGLGCWLHTLTGGGFQPLDVCLATIERFAAAYADHRGA